MRTVKLIGGIPKETNTELFPDSTVINETDTVDGTPVIREIYGDVLTNLYKILRIAGITASGDEDNEDSGYQLVQALQQFANLMNDQEQQLNLAGSVFSIGLDLTILPDKYFCFVRAVETFPGGTGFTFTSSADGDQPSYGFTAVQPFNSGDELLLIIDSSGVRAYNLNVNLTANEFTPFGNPVAFNDSAKVWYQEQGILYSDLPELYDIQAAIRTHEGDGTILAYEMVIIGNNVVCLGFFPSTQTYKMYKIPIGSFTVVSDISMAGGSFPVGTDNQPFMYTDGTFIYLTNSTGNSANAYDIDIYNINLAGNSVSLNGSVTLDNSFVKTNNVVITPGSNLYTFIAGSLIAFDLGSGDPTLIGTFPGTVGIVFGLNGANYYSSGEVAKQWTLA